MKRKIVVIAHDIRSLWNVGSIFRCSDAFAVDHLYLTGYTPAPPRKEIGKTAIGADTWIPWTKEGNPKTVIATLRKEGYQIIALEKNEKSTPIGDAKLSDSVCLILGHEVKGVSDDLLKEADEVLHIPMYGKKESLNVSTAAGIALYALREAR